MSCDIGYIYDEPVYVGMHGGCAWLVTMLSDLVCASCTGVCVLIDE